MTSIFDQYEQASQRSKQAVPPPIRPDISSAGFIQMKLQNDGPIFIKQKVNFAPSHTITHMCISNNFIVIAMANNILLRIDMKNPEKPEEIDISKFTSNMKMSGLFLDPLGQHLLISLVPKTETANVIPELFYLHRKTTKLKQSAKCRGHEITAVAWNFANTSETTSGPILLGTSKGLIFETEISLEGDKIFSTSLEQYWRQLPNYLPLYGVKEVEDGLVFDIGRNSKPPITGLEFHKVPDSDKYIIIVTTLIRIYQYVGPVNNQNEKPLLHQVFSKYLNVKERFYQLESSLPYSKMQFYYPAPKAFPTTFGWLTEIGILYAQVDPKSDPDNVLTNQQMLACPETSLMNSSATNVNPKPPLAFVLTQFHALLLYSDHVKGISLLNQELIFEDIYNDTYGKLVNITKDPINGTIWAYSERAVFKYKVTKEDRNVWQVYVDKGEFELAKQYCKDNLVHVDQVLIKQAEMLFKKKEYERSALIYAETQASFEEISLKFLQSDIEALKVFLKKKLEGLKPQDKTQTTMIVIWVVELFMNQMGILRSDLSSSVSNTQYLEFQKQFDSFLAIPKVKDCVRQNLSTICSILASHGDKENLIRLTSMHQNYEQVIRQHMYKNNYLEALEILKKQNNKELFYSFSGVLLEEVPKQTVNALISQAGNLQPSKLLPTLVSCSSDEKHAHEIIRYLEHCVNEQACQEQAIHNLLLSLYTRYKPGQVMRYINSQGQNINMVHYDVHYALRLCQEANLTEACVQLSALLGLWTTAIDLALTINEDVAKQIAAMPSHHDNYELRKKLWLKIAEHVVKERDDIQQAMDFLQECDLIHIEDILPFFSDFVTIDHFKDAICKSLQGYNQHIQDLKEEMEEATKSAEVIRKKIQNLRKRWTYVHTTSVCNTCNVQLLIRPFYVFPCGHKFHSDCLVSALTPMLSLEQQTKLADLQRQLTASSNKPEDNNSEATVSLSTNEQIKADIDDLVASECFYCGNLMIETIDKPFIKEEDYEKVVKEWA